MLRDLAFAIKKFYRNKEGALFGLLFPIAFSMIFLFALGGLISGDMEFESIPVVVVQEQESQQLNQLINYVGQEGQLANDTITLTKKEEGKFFHYVKTNAEEAESLMDEEIANFIIKAQTNNDKISLELVIAPSQIDRLNASIMYSVLNSVMAINQSVTFTMSSENISPMAMLKIGQKFEKMNGEKGYLIDKGAKGTSSLSNIFYANLGYICMFFMSMGIHIIMLNEATYSTVAAREQVSPVTKNKRMLMTFISILIPSLIITYFVYWFYLVNGVPLGDEVGRIVLILTLGVLVGLSLGTALASLFRANEGILTGISIGLPLLMGLLSGMMTDTIKGMIVNALPWVNKINPIALVSDGIYYLNNYPTYQQYNLNIMYLLIMFIILAGITILRSRGNDYESI